MSLLALLQLSMLGMSVSLSEPLMPSAGERYFSKARYDEAQGYYEKRLASDPIRAAYAYNLGGTLYRQNDFESAKKSFEKALSKADPSLQFKTFYNLGNCHYRLGEKVIDKKPEETIVLWEAGLKNYQSALELQPQSKPAQHNYAFLKKKLEELKKKQEEKKKQEPPPNPKQNPSQEPKADNKDKDNPLDNKENTPPQEQPPSKSSADQKTNPEKRGNDKPENKPNEGPAPSQQEPGSMSPQEAEQLLDTLGGNEKKLPFMPTNNTEGRAFSNPKNW